MLKKGNIYSMKKIKIAIIDSGVDDSHPFLLGKEIKGITITNDGVYTGAKDTFGHGTAIYTIISTSEYISDIINIKIEGIEEGVDEKLLYIALDYIDKNLDVDIINMSLGTNMVQSTKCWREICDKLINKGVIIVSAFDNTGSIAYPAALENVIGVTNSPLCKKKNEFVFFYDKMVNIGAMGNVQRVAWKNPKFIMNAGNSFACAYVTKQCISYMHNKEMTINELLDSFKRDAISVFDYKTEIKRQGFIPRKAVLFPFNKEMHSLVRFYKKLNFEIIDVYDTKYSGRVGSNIKKLLRDDEVLDKNIKDIESIDFASFDTLILGHTEELSLNVNKNIDEYKTELVKKTYYHQKNIYSFDDIGPFLEKNNIVDNEKIFWPSVKKENIPICIYGKLFRNSKPVLGVFGTSSKQGKFTLQLYLRYLLIERGYKVGQMGTEPSALLFGMDEVYPMGYNSSVEIKEIESIAYLNYKMHEISDKDNEIVIVGSQSGTVPYDVGNLEMFNISQYMFIQGTLPDTVILCVNTFDEMEFITRTIQFINASVQAEIIAVVIFPMALRNKQLGVYGGMVQMKEEQLKNKKEEISRITNVPSFILGNMDEMNKLVDAIIKYYS